MSYIVPEKLKNHIKKILKDDPLDIYFYSSDSYSTSITELSESRDSEYGKIVGSANLIIASALINNELTEEGLQTEDYSDTFMEIWKSFLEDLKQERFLKDSPETARENIYLAVNNEAPIEGLNNSCLKEGENSNEHINE